MKCLNILILSCLIFFFLIGCTTLTREEKNLCYEFTTKSYHTIPKCDTEEKCFIETEKYFKTNFDMFEETDLYYIKNNVGRSWFYYNKAEKELEKLSKLCFDGNAFLLTGNINQIKFYLSNAFNEIDLAMQKNIDLTIKLGNKLDNEDINQIKEEEIFQSYTEIKQIISEFQTNNYNSESYATYYLSKIESFKNKKPNYKYLIENKPLTFISSQIDYSDLKKYELNIPVIKESFLNLANYIEYLIYKSASFNELKEFPAKDFIILYTELAGTKNSTFEKFFTLMNKTSTNYSIIKNEINKLIQENNKLEIECNNLNKSTTKEYKLIENNLISSTIKSNKNLEEEYLKYQKEFNELKIKISKNIISKGQQLAKLKEIKNYFELLKKSFVEKETIYNKNLQTQCDNFAIKLKSEKFTNLNNICQNLKNEINYISTQVIENNNELKLTYCTTLINKQKELESAIEDFIAFEENKIEKTADCFKNIEEILKNYNENYLKNKFLNLKNENVTNENLFYFEEKCNNLLIEIDNKLKTNKDVLDIISKYNLLLNKQKELKSYSIYFEKNEIDELIKKINKLILEIDNNFNYIESPTLNTLALSKIYLKKETLQIKLNEINKINNSELELLKKYIFENMIIEYINENKIKLILNNIFKEINSNSKVIIDLNDYQNLEYSTINVTNITFNQFTKKLEIEFNKLNKATNEIIINGSLNIEKDIQEKIIFSNNKLSLIQKIIKLKNKINLNQINFNEDSLNSEKIIIIYNDSEIKSSINKNKVNFTIYDYDSSKEIYISYYLTNLIHIDKYLIDNREISLNKNKINYKVFIKNNYSKKISSSIILDEILNEFVESIKIYENKELSFEKVNNQIIINNFNLESKEERIIYIELTITDNEEYYKNILNNLLDRLNYYEEKEISSKIKSLLQISFNQELIKDIEKIIKDATNKLIEFDKNKEKLIIIESIKIKINEKLTELENYYNQLIDFGLEKEAKSLYDKLELIKKLNIDNDYIKIQEIINAINFDFDKTIIEYYNEKYKEISKDNNIINDNNYLTLINEFYNLKSDYEKNILFDPIKCKEILNELNEKYKEIINYKEIYEKEFNFIKIDQENEIKNEKESCISLINLINKELFENEAELINNKFIVPISKERLNEIKENLNEELNLEIINLYKNELLFVLDKIKLQVINKYNSSIENNENIEKIKKAKEEIDKNNYTSAFFILNNNHQDSNYLFNFGIIPIIIIVLSIIIIKLKYKSKKSNLNEEKEKIIQEWNN
ncbi:MAG: hypothetical protein PHQ98_00045 [Candidatus ainarchaeum sp.]|nr:hypothetical protein [Candidatus ainarchaeum sp.]